MNKPVKILTFNKTLWNFDPKIVKSSNKTLCIINNGDSKHTRKQGNYLILLLLYNLLLLTSISSLIKYINGIMI